MTRLELLEIAKPILFNTEMIRAIQDGRKTATRRIVKNNICECTSKVVNGVCKLCDDKGGFCSPDEYVKKRSPYQVGDYLYVRETWVKGRIVGSRNNYYVSHGILSDYIFKVDCLRKSIEFYGIKWTPSIHMPKEALRTFLRVTDVRVERLQDITKDGAIAEGAETDEYLDFEEWATAVAPPGSRMITLRDYFSELWNSTVKKSDIDKYGWDANPLVWVIEFERVEVE